MCPPCSSLSLVLSRTRPTLYPEFILFFYPFPSSFLVTFILLFSPFIVCVFHTLIPLRHATLLPSALLSSRLLILVLSISFFRSLCLTPLPCIILPRHLHCFFQVPHLKLVHRGKIYGAVNSNNLKIKVTQANSL